MVDPGDGVTYTRSAETGLCIRIEAPRGEFDHFTMVSMKKL